MEIEVETANIFNIIFWISSSVFTWSHFNNDEMGAYLLEGLYKFKFMVIDVCFGILYYSDHFEIV